MDEDNVLWLSEWSWWWWWSMIRMIRIMIIIKVRLRWDQERDDMGRQIDDDEG